MTEERGASAATAAGGVRVETVVLEGTPKLTVDIAHLPGVVEKSPVILMPGAIDASALPEWSTGLLGDGYMLCAFRVEREPDPDPDRRPQWLFFDQRFAHQYARMGVETPLDAQRVVDHLATRADVAPDKLGWLGSSTTGIPGLAVATQGPRLAAVVAFVSTGAYRQWFATWRPNGLWQGDGGPLWPETEAVLDHDPILHVANLYPTAVMLISGGDDKVVDPATTEEFVAAARPYYGADPERLQHVVYQGFGHNLPRDVIRLYAEFWFRSYMHPINAAPGSLDAVDSLEASVAATQVNAADHRDVVGA